MPPEPMKLSKVILSKYYYLIDRKIVQIKGSLNPSTKQVLDDTQI